MTTSLRLLLEDFLGLMREEGELDAYLPLLLSAMGHEIIYRAQKGTRQYGVDISSVGKDEDGRKKLFLWLVKCGDINRQDWDTGPQAIRQSVNDVGDTYLPTHVAAQHARLPKKLVVLTNGDFNAALNLTISSFLETWSRRSGVEAERVNGSTLAEWTERYLLDEHVLPPSNRVLFRRMLANVGSPELCVSVGRTLLRDLVASATGPAKSRAARKKRRLTALRGIRTALNVLQVWAQSERNRLAPYRLAEFALLCVWAGLHDVMAQGDRDVAQEFAKLQVQMLGIAEAYHEQVQPYYITQDAFAHVLPDSLLVADVVFQELGRLSLQGCIWSAYAAQGDIEVARPLADVYVNRVLALLGSHQCARSPSYDHHSVDIDAVLLLLLISGRRDEAKQWLRELSERLVHAARRPRYWPISAPFDDVLLIRHGQLEAGEEFMSTSTVVPMLLLWAAVLDVGDVYSSIRDTVVPAIPKTTLNFWSADAGFDAAVSDAAALHRHGVGEAVVNVPADPHEFLSLMSTPLAEVESVERAAWYKLEVSYIPLLAGLHWRLQVPREVLVKHAVAAARLGEAGPAISPAE